MSDEAGGTSLEARTQAFLAEFFNRGQELVRDLIEENEALRTELRSAESDRSPTGDLVSRLRKQIADLQDECEQIRKLAGSVQQESGDYRMRLDALEEEHYNLAARQVAAEQLRRAGSVEDAVRTTTEILLNLVGVGRFVVYGLDEERNVLFPLCSEGAEQSPPTEIPFDGEDPFAQAVRIGPWRQPEPPRREGDALMYLPLTRGRRTVAAVLLQSFLPQKQDFTDDDLALLELLSEESGAAIESAWIRAHARDVPLSRPGLEGMLT